MTYLVEILTEAGLENVKTYIQSGNIVFETDLADNAICTLIHDTIKKKKSELIYLLFLKSNRSLQRQLLKIPLMKAMTFHVFTLFLQMTSFRRIS